MHNEKNRGYKLVKKNMKQLIPCQLATFLLSLSTIVASVIIINLLQQLVNSIQYNEPAGNVYEKIIISCVVYAVCMVAFQFAFKRTQIKGANEVTILLYNKIQEKNLEFYENNKSGELLSLINNEGKLVGDWLSSGLLVLMNEFAVLILNLCMMFYYNVKLTSILCVIMLFFYLATKFLAMEMAKLSSKSLKISAKVNNFILQTLKSEMVIHTLQKNSWFKKKFLGIMKEEKYPVDYKKADYTAIYMTIFALLSVLMPIIAVIIGASISKEQAMPIGILLAFYAHTMQIQEPIRYIPEFLSQRRNTLALSEHLLEILDDKNTEENRVEKLDDKIENMQVNIEYFSYEDEDKKILKGVNFGLKKGDILLVQGESGIGKSTLASLLMGFMETNKADIIFNSVDSKLVSDSERWKHILLASQESFLIEGSIQENILMGDTISGEFFDEIVETVCLGDFLKENGADKIIGGENDGISGGQKQRINIARTLVKKPDILILDEPTSALDELTAQAFTEKMIAFSKKYDIILIVISHGDNFEKYATKKLALSKESIS